MKKGTRITLICILSILILAIIGLTIFGYVQRFSKASAEEISDNAIVNFNQLYRYRTDNISVGGLTFTNNQVINGTYVSNGYTKVSESFSVISGHKYFVRYNYDNSFYFTFNTALPDNGRLVSSQIVQAVSDSNDVYFVWHSEENVVFSNYNLNLIIVDLTQMGLDSYSLEECNTLFSSSYYEYTTGTPVYLNGLNAYQQGMNAVLDNMNATISTYLIGMNAFPYNNKNIENSELIFDNQINAYYFYGVVGIPLFDTIESGTNLQIDFNLWIPDMQGESSSYAQSFILHFGIIDNASNLVEIATVPLTKYTSFTDMAYNGGFVLPTATDTIYAWVDYDSATDQNDSATQIIVTKSDITFRSINLSSLLMSQYSKGRSDTIEYYQYGNPGYNEIFNLGKEYAIRHNLNNAWGQAWDFIESSFTGIGGIFQVELLPGVPIAVFILVPLMIGLIFFVVKLVKGGG